MHEESDNGVEYLNFFNKIIRELLVVNVKIDEEDNALILLSSLSKLYDHIVTTILYEKETLFLEEVTTILLSNKIRKKPNRDEQEGLGLVVMGRKGRRGKKSSGSSKVCHLSPGRSKKDCKHQ